MFTENDAKEALQRFALKDKDRAQLLEKMFRCESNHFKSLQFQKTGSAGMEAGLWGKYLAKYFPNGYETITLEDNKTKKDAQFVLWDNIDNFLEFLSDYINRKKGDYACWNSLNEKRKLEYRKTINRIINRFVV